MSKFEERKPEEIRAWLEESDIAQDFVAFLAEAKANNIHMLVNAGRRAMVTTNEVARYSGVIDFIDGITSMLERKPEKK
ncbi:MAG TPA: hypothetical protein VN697_03480 [Tepidiformaceae bacterium]|nr:hypothetical protein [Tepidiformaceae bacterium]